MSSLSCFKDKVFRNVILRQRLKKMKSLLLNISKLILVTVLTFYWSILNAHAQSNLSEAKHATLPLGMTAINHALVPDYSINQE